MNTGANDRMRVLRHLAVLQVVLVLLTSASASAANSARQFRYDVRPNALINISNESGNITVIPAQHSQVVVNARPSCDTIEVDSVQNGNRIRIHSHARGTSSSQDCRIDYDLQIPAGADINVRVGDGSVTLDRLQGDITVEGETARIEIHEIAGAHVHVHSVSGPVEIANASKSFVDITSVEASVTLNSVTGPKLTVNTANGTIRYSGDFGSGGDYSLMNHSGLTEVTLPASASVELTARSISGSVENDFPFKPKQQESASLAGHSFAGTSNSGASSVRISSFTGTIRVKKQ